MINTSELVARTAIVVNHNATQCILLSRLLGTIGLEVRSFEGAEAALLSMDRARPLVLIVTDLYMPGIDGWRFCRLLRSPEHYRPRRRAGRRRAFHPKAVLHGRPGRQGPVGARFLGRNMNERRVLTILATRRLTSATNT